mmetsp:Transcript_90898/g.293492  ORF Transcript_90898/g.293492 Transcript_90898/m.293492 type:complete len:230 (-) Transcript_90898:315-1004(-)
MLGNGPLEFVIVDWRVPVRVPHGSRLVGTRVQAVVPEKFFAGLHGADRDQRHAHVRPRREPHFLLEVVRHVPLAARRSDELAASHDNVGHQPRPMRWSVLAQLLPRWPAECHRDDIGKLSLRRVVAQVAHCQPISMPKGGLRQVRDHCLALQTLGIPSSAIHRYTLVLVGEKHVAHGQVALGAREDTARIKAHQAPRRSRSHGAHTQGLHRQSHLRCKGLDIGRAAAAR